MVGFDRTDCLSARHPVPEHCRNSRNSKDAVGGQPGAEWNGDHDWARRCGRKWAVRRPFAGRDTRARVLDSDPESCALKKRESADKPGSVAGNHPSGTRVAARLERPTRKLLRAAAAGPKARVFPYLVLLQVGFAVPPNVATGAVRSYRTLSPLPAPASRRALGRSALCCTFRGLAPPRRYLAPCPAEPGLSSAFAAAVVWPTPATIIPVDAGAARVHRVPCARDP